MKTLEETRKAITELCEQIIETCNDNIKIEGYHNDDTVAYTLTQAEEIEKIILDNVVLILDLVKADDAAMDDIIHEPKEE